MLRSNYSKVIALDRMDFNPAFDEVPPELPSIIRGTPRDKKDQIAPVWGWPIPGDNIGEIILTRGLIINADRVWSLLRNADGKGKEIEVHLYPKPQSRTLPCWLTTSRSIRTFEEAGRRGCNVLTALLRLSADELQERIAAYRNAPVRRQD